MENNRKEAYGLLDADVYDVRFRCPEDKCKNQIANIVAISNSEALSVARRLQINCLHGQRIPSINEE